MYAGVKARGARFITALIENASSGPSTQASADTWVTTYKCPNDVTIDPTKKIFSGLSGSIGLPYNVIIDPRTMKVTNTFNGAGPSVDSAVNSLITKNGG